MHKLLIDTDPGIDDAMAILYAGLHPEIEIVGMTAVFGNISVEIATRNAGVLSGMLGRQIPVARGAARPLVQPPHPVSDYVHGPEGFGDLPAEVPPYPALDTPAAQFICDTINAQPGEITLVPVGPLTNIAAALGLAREALAHEVHELRPQRPAQAPQLLVGEARGAAERVDGRVRGAATHALAVRLAGLRREPGVHVHAVGHVADRHVARRLRVVGALPHLARHLAVQMAVQGRSNAQPNCPHPPGHALPEVGIGRDADGCFGNQFAGWINVLTGQVTGQAPVASITRRILHGTAFSTDLQGETALSGHDCQPKRRTASRLRWHQRHGRARLRVPLWRGRDRIGHVSPLRSRRRQNTNPGHN